MADIPGPGRSVAEVQDIEIASRKLPFEIVTAPKFRYTDKYHQQYLATNPNGYCGTGGCGVAYRPKELTSAEKA